LNIVKFKLVLFFAEQNAKVRKSMLGASEVNVNAGRLLVNILCCQD